MVSRRIPPAPSASLRGFELYDDRMPIRRYKLLLQAFLKRRGPGTRQAIAAALGNTRSFVTQMTSPAYGLPIPPQHVRTIIRLAALQPNEERMFLDAYILAHPDRAAEVLGRVETDGRTRMLTVAIPALSDPRAQQRLEKLVERFARDVAAAMVETEADREP